MRPSARAFAEPRPHLGDGADRPHVQPPTRHGARRPRRARPTAAAARACAPRPRRAGAPRCSSSPRAIGPVSARLGPERGPVARGGEHERGELRAVDPGGGREPLGAGLQRDEEVRRDRAGRVVGDAVLRRDAAWRACRARSASACGDLPARAAVVPSTAAAGAARGRPARCPAGTDISGCREKRLARRRSTSRPVAPEQWPSSGPAGTAAAACGDLAVGHAQQHDRRVAAGSARRAERPRTAYQRRGQHRAETARADDRRRQAPTVGSSGPVPASRYRLDPVLVRRMREVRRFAVSRR